MAKVEKVYDLSPMQEGMLYHSLLQENTEMYFQQVTFSIQGDLDIHVFEQSIQQLIQRHDILRTNFVYQKIKKPQQVVLDHRKVIVHYEDLSNQSDEAFMQFMQSFLVDDRRAGFNLRKDVLMRFAIFKRADQNFRLVWSYHHILLDGWSIGIIMNELLQIYLSLKKQQPIQFEKVKPYQEFIKWLDVRDNRKSLNYWKQYLQGYQYRPLIPMKPSQVQTPDQYKTVTFTLDEEMTESLIHLGKKHHITLNTLFQAIWGVLLQRYTYQEDVVFGSVISGRSAAIQGIEKMVGLFINTVPVRIAKSDGSFIAFARELQQQFFAAEEHGYCPLYEIQEQSGHKQELFDHIIAFENFPLDQEIGNLQHDQESMLKISDVTSFEQTNYPLTISVNPKKSLEVRMKYNHSFINQEFIDRIENHFKKVTQTVVDRPNVQVRQIDILTDSEKQQILNTWNDTRMEYPKEKTIHQWFEERVDQAAHHVAVVFKEKRLTYLELNEQANRLARVLRQRGVKPEDRVGLIMERSFDMIIGILGILKAGGSYVPIDPEYPIERIRYMIADSGSNLVLSQSRIMERLDPEEVESVEWLDVQALDMKGMDCSNLPHINQSSDLAYVIYTSGTTGRPKGVMMEHRQLVNLLHNQISSEEIAFTGKVLQFSSISFDVSFQEIFSALLSGGCLYVIESQMRQNIVQLLTYIEEQDISIVYWPVSYAKAVFQLTDQLPQSIQHVITAGEQLVVPSSLKQCIRQSDVQLHNHYGPSETHVVTTYKLTSDQEIVDYPPIGKPIANTKIYLLHENGQLQPPGVVGEIYISGDSVSRGYLGKPELTAAKFLPSPFVLGERMYRTGDLGRYLPDGNIEFLGRVDHQVKIRGYRIELDEIASVFLEHPKVKDVVVQDWKSDQDETYLCAYVVLNEPISSSELKKYLKQKLPDYMIPSFILEMDQLPLTTNGKVDRKALPLPNESKHQVVYVPPTTEMEKQLVEIWQHVLGIDRVGITDHFFHIGGHSLKIIQLVSMIHQKLQIELPVRAIFEYPSIQELTSYLAEREKTDFQSIQPAPSQPYYPLSSAQKRMFVLQQMELNSTHYHLPGAVMIEGELDIQRLERAFQKLIERHEALRTSFELVDGEPMQKIHPKVPFKITVQKGTKREAENRINQFVRPFSLEQAPLFRVELIQLQSKKHLLLIDIHHIITDGISTDVMLDDLSKLYRGEKRSDLPIQYKDFAVWQQEWMESDSFHQQEKYWLETFSDEIPVLELPTDYMRPEVQNFAGSHESFVLNEELTKSLKRLASTTGTTLYMLLLAAYSILLQKYSKQAEVIIGTPVVGRSHADIQSVMGLFVNTLAIRTRPEGHKSVVDFVREVKEEALGAYDHADYPFEILVEKLSLKRDTSRNPLFQAMFTMQDFGSDTFKLDGLQVKPLELEYAISKFDLSLVTKESQDQIICQFEYAHSLFKRETIERMKQHFEQIVNEMVTHPNKKIKEVDMLTDQEKYQLLVEWNHTTTPYPKQKTIHEWFEEQVAKTPNNIAVVCKDGKLTYQELNERANRLAHVLRKREVKPDDRVGLLLARSFDVVVGILGILKAGGAYVPIDPSYPVERIRYMLEDSQAMIVLSQASIIEKLLDEGNEIGEWLDIGEVVSTEVDSSNLSNMNKPTDLAYVIYTSGTTGQPKGVMVEHQSLIHLICHFQTEFLINEQDRVGQFANISFDAAVWEIGVSLLSGACLYMIPHDVVLSPVDFEQYVNQHHLSILLLPPTYLCYLHKQNMKSLRKVMVGGSASSSNLVEHWKEIYTNAYGPTETTVCATTWEPTKEEDVMEVPIGKPISNTKIYILDENLQLQPIGVPGELCIGGDGLARGYLNKPELTAEKFILNPFIPGERIYRTGDVARYLSDGNIEFLGRIDEQVKVRGYRIELGEIESILMSHPNVKNVTVREWTDEQDEMDLCAYVVLNEHISSSELRKYLRRKLPDYMIPSFIMEIDEIPISPHGKVDRSQLPKPDGLELQTEYVAPVTEMEKKLAHIWQQVLGLRKIGVTHHFFELGGDSIKAIQIAAMLQKENLILSVNHLFRAPTIQKVIPYIKSKKQQVKQDLVQGEVPLTPIQAEFFMHAGSYVNHFNQSILLYSPTHLHEDVLNKVLMKLVEHHDALRMIYRKQKDQWIQMNRGLEETPFQLDSFDLRNEKNVRDQIEELANQMQSSLDITKGLLMKVGLFQTDHGDYLLIIIHHLVVDGVSWRILLEDFESGYQQALKQQPIQLPLKTDSYLAWANGLREYAISSQIQKEIPYWEKLCQSEIVPLPKDREVKESFIQESDYIELSLTKEQTKQLLSQIHHAYNTEINDILLTAVGLTVKDWVNTDQVSILLEGHGREEILETIRLHRTIGWFTSCYPVVFDFAQDDSEESIDQRLSDSIKKVKETLRRIPNRGIGFSILKYLRQAELRSTEFTHFRPEITFNYLGQFDPNTKENGHFQISSLKTGKLVSPQMKRRHTIEMNGLIFNGKFTLQVGYSCKEYNRETIIKFTQYLKENLEQLIKHCAGKSETEITPSDVGDKNLSLEDLQYMQSILEG
ncbi:non-ribosomal peptide synthetase [Thermoflavimicrobium daqui]|uniref:Non-ribosomal peptide synthetase n=1 Tax=Thermoflavimicrobium daqui TaxID=2137476 RepID=A0A364K6F8_9BACL|nr:non-ribosomal peptide synthetase [Thermoflavimicrobium daqui]RAL25792.1 non-ribosomal peptide synthetase [Thermoflavimicrobium daqui]